PLDAVCRALTQRLVTGKEEQVVFFRDRAADIPAELTAAELAFGDAPVVVGPIVRIQRLVAHEIVDFAMELAGPTTSDEGDDACSTPLVLGIVDVLDDLLFLNGVLDGGN